MIELRNAEWELCDPCHPNFDSNGEIWGELYRYPIWKHVPAGVSVTDGWGQSHKAPSTTGNYTLYQYVQDGNLMGFQWEGETK